VTTAAAGRVPALGLGFSSGCGDRGVAEVQLDVSLTLVVSSVCVVEVREDLPLGVCVEVAGLRVPDDLVRWMAWMLFWEDDESLEDVLSNI